MCSFVYAVVFFFIFNLSSNAPLFFSYYKVSFSIFSLFTLTLSSNVKTAFSNSLALFLVLLNFFMPSSCTDANTLHLDFFLCHDFSAHATISCSISSNSSTLLEYFSMSLLHYYKTSIVIFSAS